MRLQQTIFLVTFCVLLSQAFFSRARESILDTVASIQSRFMAFLYVTIKPQVILPIDYLFPHNRYAQVFVFLILFRYTRLLVNICGFWTYKPTPIPDNPKLTSADVNVIVPTVDPFNADFAECIDSIAATRPGCIIIVAAGGHRNVQEASKYCHIHLYSNIIVLASKVANVSTSWLFRLI